MGSILIACVFLVAHCGKKEDDFPQILLGRWETEAERYQDRYIEFSRELIIYGTGADAPNIYFVRKVNQKQNGSETEYTFVCTDTEHTEFDFIFHVEGGGDSLNLRLNNPREVVWNKITEQ
jgi:hypothetical protein